LTVGVNNVRMRASASGRRTINNLRAAIEREQDAQSPGAAGGGGGPD
jgi:hypothetical protein